MIGSLLRRLARNVSRRTVPKYRRTVIGIQLESRRHTLHVVGTDRLDFYPRGVEGRFAQLAAEYGVPDHIRVGHGDIVIDVGANIGEFAILCSGAGATVYAMEPDVNAFLCLAKNVEGLDVIPLNVAAWNQDSVRQLHMASSSADSSFVNRSGESREVLALRLDSFARMRGLDKVKLIKCDAEGAEPEVLAGAVELLAITEYVSFDCGIERAGVSTLEECDALLRRAGFEIVRRENGGRHNLIARNAGVAVAT